jgi:hypothetical protein
MDCVEMEAESFEPAPHLLYTIEMELIFDARVTASH